MLTIPGPGWAMACLCSCFMALATWSEPFDFIGIPAPVIFMAFAGATAGLILHPPRVSRRATMMLALAFTFFGAACTAILGEIPHMAWVKNAAPAAAGLLALFGQALVPAVRQRLLHEVRDRGAPQGHEGGSP